MKWWDTSLLLPDSYHQIRDRWFDAFEQLIESMKEVGPWKNIPQNILG